MKANTYLCIGFFYGVMRIIVVSILSIIIVVVNAQFGLQLAIYEIFKPNIIETFCVNKDVKDSDCEAMCKMSELAQDDANNDEKHSTTLEHEIQIKLFGQSIDMKIESEWFVFNDQLIDYLLQDENAPISLANRVNSPPPQA